MYRFGLSLALLFAVIYPAAGAPTGALPHLDLKKDTRLGRAISIPGETVRLQQLLPIIGDQTQVDLMVQGDLLRRHVAISVKNKTAAEVLDNLAVLFGGAWIKRGDGYLLLTDEVVAGQVARYPPASSTVEAERRLFSSLSPRQVNLLQMGRDLRFERLTVAQQKLVQAVLRDRYLRNPERYPSSILMGKDVSLVRLLAPAPGPDGRIVILDPPQPGTPYTVEVQVPTVTDLGGLEYEFVASSNGGR